ncbi:MAG: ATP-dependent RNA helicase HrpA [Aquincola sp.]|nr:ATP-dependent RNA helicase HrpA [Aquincola sp.]MDH5328832.1 ATP-dependent RNA helicase HrpA [Aquincola sp.]
MPTPDITFPESLPVSARREEIARAFMAHPVIVVCGETGSGKTTQLPKLVLSLGRAAAGKWIGHTQPRRIAAQSVAKRIAEELNTPLGEVVGFKVRFQDRVQRGASIKLMTDGILLAETQSDPLLGAYDTIIVDEAHERSLNIDFLLGHLKQILARRPDLKVIVTSATIDAERFSAHFGGAPVIQVSGRLFPVEQRWRPFEETRDRDLNVAIADAVDELWRGTIAGDVLVFLPGEREIREAADHLRKHLAHDPRRRHAEILPLFSRLSQAEQDRVFDIGGAPRVVLATNVAETSLTVPGIRYVVDAGTARVKRYSYRSKVEQLQIEPISQAAANQRAGRCGRVADGICIRLYDEADFASRPRFTDPEILRSSLAGVILRMASLGLGMVEEFPFLEAPPKKAIADGYALLNELGAVDERNELTELGRALARLPLDPRVGRMILEGRERQSLAEVLVIAAALSGQDVRDRPVEQAQAADAKHKLFDDDKSEFMGYLKLWRWIEEGRGRSVQEPAAPAHGRTRGAGPACEPGRGGGSLQVHKLSNRQQEQRLRDHFVSPRRVREWRDIHSQLLTVVTEHGWRVNTAPANYEQVHLALLSGLLGNVGCKADDDDWYQGARGIKFWRHPGAHLSKKPGRWLIAAELVETTRLFGRGLAAIEPQWIERIGGHLIKTQLSNPHWEKKAGEVMALERGLLYGLVVYQQRSVAYARVDPVMAREIFIREALVAGDWETKLPFLAHNDRLVREVRELEHKARRQDVLVDDELIFAFYDQQLPAHITGGAGLERWYGDEVKRQPNLLKLTRDELMRHEAAGITTDAFPKVIRLGGIDCAAHYLHEPGDPKDGLTVTVPIYALNQVSDERCEWLVPGMLEAKIVALLKSLPQKPRARLVPLADSAATLAMSLRFGDGSLVDALLCAVRERTQLPVQRTDFKVETLSAHHFMNVRVVDEHGRQLGVGRHLAALKAELGGQARTAFQALAALKTTPVAAIAAPDGSATPTRAQRVTPATPIAPSQARFVAWTFGELPELMEVRKAGQSLVGFPALVDKGAHVEIEVFDEPDVAAARHRAGLRRLVALQLKDPLKFLEKNIPDLQRMATQFMSLGTQEDLRDQIVALALDRAFLSDPLPSDATSFEARVEAGRARLNLIAHEVARAVAAALQEFAHATRKLKDARPPKDVVEDVSAQLARLVHKRFVLETPWIALGHLPRYLRAVQMRLDKQRVEPLRDAQRLAELKPLEQRWMRRVAERRGAPDARLDEFRWVLEELRVSLFAQELRTPQPVSVKRLERIWSQLSA